MRLRYRYSSNPLNFSREESPLNLVLLNTRDSWQWQFKYLALPWLDIGSRIYLLCRTAPETKAEHGYLVSQDFQLKPLNKRYSLSMRYALFDTDSYDSRMYAYENDVPGSYSVPALSGKGSRYYLMIKIQVIDRCDLWLRISQTFYPGVSRISEGPAMISGNSKSDFKAMIRIKF